MTHADPTYQIGKPPGRDRDVTQPSTEGRTTIPEMAAPTLPPPPNKTFDDSGAGSYEHPRTGEQFLSVTTALGSVNKPALVQWAANLAATCAVELIPTLVHSMLIPECGKHHTKDRCGDCTPCLTRRASLRHYAENQRRKQEGTETHHSIDTWIQGGQLNAFSPACATYVEQFRMFCDDYGLTRDNFEAGSATILNRANRYAGTLDWISQIADKTPAASALLQRLGLPQASIMVDCKTREKPDARMFPETPLQLVAYRRGETIMRRDGEEVPLPAVDATAMLQLRPGGYTLWLTNSEESTFQAFLAVLQFHRWEKTAGAASVVESAAVAPSPKPTTTTRKVTKPAKAIRHNATVESMKRDPVALIPRATAHPDSPYDDEIPF